MTPHAPRTPRPVFCPVVPPHILDRLAENGNEAAARTLAADTALRTRRTEALLQGPSTPQGGASDRPNRTIYDAGHHEVLPGRKVHGEGDGPSADSTVNRAHAGLGATFDFFLSAYGHASMDGSGMALDATVHYGEQYNNAFWDGTQMVFGDGDGDIFLDFTIPVDVIGHELTHGFTQFTANLEYYGQSGALNESVSDVFGSLIKQYALGQSADQADWLIGQGLLGPGVDRGVALRSMKEPGTAYDDDVLGTDPQPGHMDDYVRTNQDNGGVHINSGIPNHAFYLLATELGGNAWDRAGRIWYDVMTGGTLTTEPRFREFAAATLASARSLYGDAAELQAVTKAWSAVGVPTD